MSRSRDDLTRRSLLRAATTGGLGMALGAPLARVLAYAGDRQRSLRGAPAEWGEALPDGLVRCRLCPRNCLLSEGQVCFCRNRANQGGRLVTLAHDSVAVLEAAPIEKGPLFHFWPGARALLLGAAGCNLRCLYCQNWPASQRRPGAEDDALPAAQAPGLAKGEVCSAVGFNFTEPSTTYELTRDVAAAARREGLGTYMASALSVNAAPLERLLEHMDAVVGSLKGIRPDFYSRVVGGELAPVLAALRQVKASGTWLEVAHVIVPTLNDDPEDLRELCKWVAGELGPETPLHLLRFRPEWKLENLPPTPRATMEAAWAIAREEGLLYPYIGNLSPNPGNHTYCPGCGEVVVRRLGMRILESRLAPGGACLSCDASVHGVYR